MEAPSGGSAKPGPLGPDSLLQLFKVKKLFFQYYLQYGTICFVHLMSWMMVRMVVS
jgi:hypothetical protein